MLTCVSCCENFIVHLFSDTSPLNRCNTLRQNLDNTKTTISASAVTLRLQILVSLIPKIDVLTFSKRRVGSFELSNPKTSTVPSSLPTRMSFTPSPTMSKVSIHRTPLEKRSNTLMTTIYFLLRCELCVFCAAALNVCLDSHLLT